jgi:outer membrane protein
MCCIPVFAQQPLKFGHVNTEELFAALPELDNVEKLMEVEYKKQESQLTTLQEAMKAKQEEYMKLVKTMSAEERAQREDELTQMNQRVQNFYTLAQQLLQSKEQELKAPLLRKVETAIQEVGEENGFLYIFEVTSGVPVFRSAKSVDVNPLVKAKLGIK